MRFAKLHRFCANTVRAPHNTAFIRFHRLLLPFSNCSVCWNEDQGHDRMDVAKKLRANMRRFLCATTWRRDGFNQVKIPAVVTSWSHNYFPNVSPCTGTFSCPRLPTLVLRYKLTLRLSPDVSLNTNLLCGHPFPSAFTSPRPGSFSPHQQVVRSNMRFQLTLPAFLAAASTLVNAAPSRYVCLYCKKQR